jgi:hypothetical protein
VHLYAEIYNGLKSEEIMVYFLENGKKRPCLGLEDWFIM